MTVTCDDLEPLADASVDGELDLERALAVEAHVAGCAGCAARLEGTRALARTLRTAPYFRAPDGSAERLRGTKGAAAAISSRWRRTDASRAFHRRLWPWLPTAASLAAVSLAVAGLLYGRAAVTGEATMQAVVEGHLRSLMADHLTDVSSSDQHTVKPWFTGRIEFSPAVVDLASEGFPLTGGRLDYVDHHTAVALIYKRREHVINVFVWPDASGSPRHTTRSDARGYHVTFWTSGGVAVWVVSDLALDELDAFAQTLDASMRH
jgi:anti-sigma factor RsiW